RFGYAGGFGYQEDDGGFKLLGHRYYDPSTGRFLTRDPAKAGRNWYVYCDNSAINAYDNEGLAKVYVGTRPVGPGWHVYILVEDELTGDTWTVEGGPSRRTGGIIRDFSGPTGPNGGPDGGGNYSSLQPRVIPPDVVLIKDDDRRGEWWYSKLNHIGGEIEAEEHNYWITGPNSNSFASTILQRSGLSDEWNAVHSGAPRRWAPGFNILLPRGGSD
ncbi:MAG: hypothetical protein KF812_11385, partial [Fimbriimonadaceae bacterium]|nr:hypothetical protein [Fimbriimonadaceae bacterium]